jgi:hypothetical protein
MKSGRIHRVAVAQTRAPHFYPGGLVYEPAHCLAYAGPLQFHGEYRLLAVLHNSTWAQGKLLKGEFAAFPLGRRWVVQHPQLTLWDRVRGMQHSLKAGSHLGEGGLRGQGVRWNVPTSIPGPALWLVPRECPLPIPTNPLRPRTTPTFPRRPMVVNAVPQKQACSLLRCQLPKARGRLPTGQLPQQKQVYPSASTPTSSRVTCVFVQTDYFNASFACRWTNGVRAPCKGT